MPVVDLLFDWGDLLLNTYSSIAEWFCSPIDFGIRLPWEDKLFGDSQSIAAWVCENIFGVEMTPISLILGPGLTLFLGYTLLKWILDLVL